jgi:F420-non-reducing hydrogenase small subunit
VADKKLQIAIYWSAACGGCDVSILDTNEFILVVDEVADVRLWPIAADGKYADVEAMEDKELDVAFFNGAVRNSENEHIAKLLRQKSKILVAYGSCASMGGIPGLANLTPRDQIIETAYLNNPSIEPGNRTVPLPESNVNGYQLTIPKFYDRVYKLDQVTDVDYYVPGCPPAADQAKEAILALVAALTGQADPPPKGAWVGCGDLALCDECPRTKGEKKLKRFYRPWQIMQDPDICLMEQGILCAGMATRSGCGARCPSSGIPCRGCYGPAPGVHDQGAKLVSAVASIIDSKDPEEINEILSTLPDFTNYANRFSIPASPLQRSHRQ